MSMNLGCLVGTAIFAVVFAIAVTAQIRAKAFWPMLYWATIMFSQTLGTALGDWTADTAGLGYTGAAVVFGALLLVLVAAYLWTRTSRTFLFWAAFILTRPLGAVVGDFLDKPVSAGGLALSRYSASFALLAFILSSLILFRQRAAAKAH
ncbi:membrane protein [Pandoraea capi]|uniref:Membrane protein n=1 Tax=Pandoraea capi TaxID=2508286 RepID=A0ABY6VR97_9BURK|nr:membrane protein [Pandoraea capi]